jgi:hypothetical protein
MCGAVLLCITVLVGAVACSSGVSKAPNGMTANEILAMSQNASTSMNTLQGYVTDNASVMGEEMNASFSISADIPSRRLHRLYMPTGDGEAYILNNWVYIYSPTEAKWVETPLTEYIWSEEYSIDQQLAVLSNFTDAKYIGTELVQGVDCYKISVHPSTSAILDMFNMSEVGIGPSDINVENCAYTAWINESTYYPVQTSLNVILEMENVTLLDNRVCTISNINQPVNIVLPAEAQNATTLTNAQFESGNW